MKIGILQAGRTPDELLEQHGDYDAMFRRLLADQGFEFTTYPVLDNVLPADVYAADGWLITGSKFGVYEDHAWIAPLEDFLRAAYASACLSSVFVSVIRFSLKRWAVGSRNSLPAGRSA